MSGGKFGNDKFDCESLATNKPHYVYRAKRWWRFTSRKHHKAFVEFAFGRGPRVATPIDVKRNSYLMAEYKRKHARTKGCTL